MSSNKDTHTWNTNRKDETRSIIGIGEAYEEEEEDIVKIYELEEEGENHWVCRRLRVPSASRVWRPSATTGGRR